MGLFGREGAADMGERDDKASAAGETSRTAGGAGGEACLSIGEMAALNCVSERALRHYQDKGLLTPAHVDAANGYRYYDIDQCAAVDMILEFQELGFSIGEIRDVLETRSIDALEEALLGHVAKLDAEIAKRRSAREDAQRLLKSCRTIRESPLFNVCMVENIHERRLVSFEIFNERAVDLTDDGEAYLREWEMNLRLTKRAMIERGLSHSLFRRVGCRIAKEGLSGDGLKLTGSFIMLEGEQAPEGCAVEVLPAGRYVTLYTDRYVAPDGSNAELHGIRKLLGYAQRHHFEVAGDYLGEIVAETPAFRFEGRDMLFKQQIPVSVVD